MAMLRLGKAVLFEASKKAIILDRGYGFGYSRWFVVQHGGQRRPCPEQRPPQPSDLPDHPGTTAAQGRLRPFGELIRAERPLYKGASCKMKVIARSREKYAEQISADFEDEM